MSEKMFKALGIDHLSASSLSKWTGDRGAWVAHYVFGVKSEVGAAAWRGSAVEAGLAAYLSGSNVPPIDHAMMSFERDAQGDLDEAVEKERSLITPMLQQAIAKWDENKLRRPVTQQVRVETWLDGVAVPLIGYVDYVLEGYCLDLKTTKALPSAPRHDHVLQTAGYAHARKEQRASLLYVTGKKAAIYEIDAENIREGIADLARRARGLQATLMAAWSKSGGDGLKTRHALADMCPPNIDSFYWSPPNLQRARAHIPAWQ